MSGLELLILVDLLGEDAVYCTNKLGAEVVKKVYERPTGSLKESPKILFVFPTTALMPLTMYSRAASQQAVLSTLQDPVDT